ncbi:MAG: hypothetical protein HFJ60_06370 [Clostridia bacterium]|jgi:hypothetical protein|nr:hypothetical protein [Clostridia bacterium]
MIQIITYDTSKYKEYSEQKYKISVLGEIQALDDFEICIIDLTNKDLWNYNNDKPISVNCYRDLLTIKEAIINSNSTKIVMVLPQNEKISYNQTYEWSGSNKRYFYLKTIQLKDNKTNLIKIINDNLFNIKEIEILFEKTKTNIINKNIDADFNFSNYEEEHFEAITYSKNSNKITTIKKDKIFITTLKILDDIETLKIFIDSYCNEEQEKEDMPDWVKDIKFYNDEELKKSKNDNLEKIQKLKGENLKLEEQINKNLEYKSILYSSGDELVKVVLEILDEILQYDSRDFVDEKREDFLIKKEDITFIGEIKGVSSAIANKNVSQLDVHVQSYVDKLQEEGKEENVKGLLIVNHQRNKPLEERQEVHEHQKKLATRNGSLIIETQTLLKIFEKYKKGKLTKEKCKKLFIDNEGLLII